MGGSSCPGKVDTPGVRVKGRRACAGAIAARVAVVAITGASGFLGGHLVRVFGERGATVRAVVRTPARAAGLGADVEVVRGDLGDPQSLVAAFTGADAVIANAALSTRLAAPWREFEATNLAGVEHTMRAAAAAGVGRVVLISTVAVYRAWPGRRNGLDTPLLTAGRFPIAPSSLTTNWRYSLSKARGEALAWRLAAELGIALTVLRPGPLYGPGDTKLTAIYAGWMRRAVHFAPTVGLPHAHGADVAGAVAGALENPRSAGCAYNVTGVTASPWQVLRVWKRLVGAGPVLIPVPVPLTMAFDDAAAVRDLGFAPRSLEDGIRDVLAHPIAARVT